MTTNLNVSKFRNGDPIPEVKSDEEWEKAEKNKQPAWCYYDNNPSNGVKYGKLYNWWAVNDPRGLAPEGWHIPSLKEFYFGDISQIGSELKTKSGWNDYEAVITCSKCDGEGWYFQSTCTSCKGTQEITTTYSGNGNNSLGFSAFPGGFRYWGGKFSSLGLTTNFWTSTFKEWYESGQEKWNQSAVYYSLNEDDVFYESELGWNGIGNSVRCIKDTKDYILQESKNLEKQNLENIEKQKVKNFEQSFSAVLNNRNFDSLQSFLVRNKLKIIDNWPKSIDDYNNSIVFKNTREILIILANEITYSINDTEDYDGFKYISRCIDKLKDENVIEISNLLKPGDSFHNELKNINQIEKFVDFKKKIFKVQRKGLTDFEIKIVGKWGFETSKDTSISIELKENREYVIIKRSKTREYSFVVEEIQFGTWEFDGENLVLYSKWDYNKGKFEERRDNQLIITRLREKFEPKFLIGDKFSIKDFEKAIIKLSKFTSEVRNKNSLMGLSGSNLVGYSFARKEAKNLDVILDLCDALLDKKIPEIKLESSDYKTKVDDIRLNYETIIKYIENYDKNMSENEASIIEIEMSNSMNLNKNDLIKSKFRVEGSKAIFEGIEGKRIK